MAQVITPTDLRDYLGVAGSGRDAKVTLIANGLNEFVVNYTHRDWQQIERTGEKYPGPGGRVLVLKHYPVTEITALTEDGNTIDPTLSSEIELDPDLGFVFRISGNWFRTLERIYTITYTGGPNGVPADLMMATLEMGAYLWRTTGGRREYATGPIVNKLFFDSMTKLPGVRDVLDQHRDSARGLIRYTA